MPSQIEKYRGDGFVLYRRTIQSLVVPEHDHYSHAIHLQVGDPVVRELRSNGHCAFSTLTPGTVALFPAGTRHMVAFEGVVDQLILNIEPQCLSKNLAETTNEGFELREQNQISDTRVELLVRALYANFLDGCPAVGLCTGSLVASISLCIAQRYANLGRNVTPCFGMPRARLNRVLAMIEEKLADNICLTDLAQAAGMSVFHFAKLFKKSTGQSPYQYVLRLRIERAKKLLRDSRMSVLEVSVRTGFVDQRHFTKAFRQKIGATPTAYRAAI